MEVDSGCSFQNFEKVEVESGHFLKKTKKSVESGKAKKWIILANIFENCIFENLLSPRSSPKRLPLLHRWTVFDT